GQSGATYLRIVGISLDLTGSARRGRQRAVVEQDGIPGILPALVVEAQLGLAFVLDVAVAVAVAEFVDPVDRSAGVGLKRAHQVSIASPAFVLIQQHQEERRGVTGAVVRRLRPFVETCQLAKAQLMQDASRLFFRKRDLLLSLSVRQRPERGSR